VQSLLSDMGARVTAVDSGYAALAAADAQRFELILMDIRMPGMDGLQASMAIRQREQQQQRAPVPIVALTAHVLPNQKRTLLQAGINDLMSKPIDEQQLGRLLHKWAGKQLSAAIAPTAMPASESLEILDQHEALRLAGGKPELASDLLAMLLGSLDEEQQAIARARTSNNAVELAERVHRLLGATRYCGVPQLRTICQHCENLLRQDNAPAGPALDQLDQAINRLRQASARLADQYATRDS
jgi:two-component system sensor histidine kinase BarA